MTTTLEEKIEERKKQAENRNISVKASTIAKYFGFRRTKPDCGDETTVYKFSNENFVINNQWTVYREGVVGFGTDISYKEQTVFSMGGGTIYSYVPGDWETELNNLYASAQKAESVVRAVKNERQQTEQAEKEADLRKKFGL